MAALKVDVVGSKRSQEAQQSRTFVRPGILVCLRGVGSLSSVRPHRVFECRRTAVVQIEPPEPNTPEGVGGSPLTASWPLPRVSDALRLAFEVGLTTGE